MNRNQVEGRFKDVAGHLQRWVGKASGNMRQQLKGAATQVEGKVQTSVGDVEQAVLLRSRQKRPIGAR